MDPGFGSYRMDRYAFPQPSSESLKAPPTELTTPSTEQLMPSNKRRFSRKPSAKSDELPGREALAHVPEDTIANISSDVPMTTGRSTSRTTSAFSIFSLKSSRSPSAVSAAPSEAADRHRKSSTGSFLKRMFSNGSGSIEEEEEDEETREAKTKEGRSMWRSMSQAYEAPPPGGQHYLATYV